MSGYDIDRRSEHRDRAELFERVERLERVHRAETAAGAVSGALSIEKFQPPTPVALTNETNTSGDSSDWITGWANFGWDAFGEYDDFGNYTGPYEISADGTLIGWPFVAGAVYFLLLGVRLPDDPTSGLQNDDVRKEWSVEVRNCQGGPTIEDLDDGVPFDLAYSSIAPVAGWLDTFGLAVPSYEASSDNSMSVGFFFKTDGGDAGIPAMMGLKVLLKQTHPGADSGLRQTDGIEANLALLRISVPLAE